MPRLTLDYDEQTGRDLEQIQKSLRLGSKADVMRKALGLLKFYTEEKEHGASMIFENKSTNERKEVVAL
jgi:hypothetical protein